MLDQTTSGNTFVTYCLFSIVWALSGCGSDRPAGVPVGGEVVVDGKAVTSGAILFIPDFEDGNAGPATYVSIANGKFESESGHGVMPGPNLVEVSVFDDSGAAKTKSSSGEQEVGGVIAKYATKSDVPEDGDGSLKFSFKAADALTEGGAKKAKKK